ncbi:MAG: hypothetical protein K0Q91_497 [Fibrobacteria bacterium]|jgi:hypothetical protein|nr:hypothetical protein [Fibrobacteria bacterium]
MKTMPFSIGTLGLAVLATLSHADEFQIPYTSGKLAQSVVITLNNGASISPDSIRVGTAFVVRTYVAYNGLTVCSNSHELGLMFHLGAGGSARRRPAIDTNWMTYAAYPMLSSMINLDSVPRMSGPGGPPVPPGKAPGYIFARPGDVQCMTDTYSADSAFSQVVFVQSGSVYAKLKIVGYTHTLPGPPPPQYQPKTLNTITLRVVVNTNANDLVDPNPPASLRGPYRKGYARGQSGDLYNPLGIRLDRVPGRFEPGLRVPR